MTLRLGGCVMALLVAGTVAAGQEKPARSLRLLTVPSAALPAGCALKPVPRPPAPRSTGGVIVTGSPTFAPFPSNPWIGTDRTLVASIRRRIDGAPKLPDAPPLDRKEMAALESKWLENIAEAYSATYMYALDGSEVGVSAITFNDAKLAETAQAAGAMDRFVWGASLVVVAGRTSNACSRSVETYVRALK